MRNLFRRFRNNFNSYNRRYNNPYNNRYNGPYGNNYGGQYNNLRTGGYGTHTVLSCQYCGSKLRVPLNVGKIKVTCTVCKGEFRYNPNSILHTLKQILISMKFKLPKDRKKRALLFAALVIILALVIYIFSNNFNQQKDIDFSKPGKVVYRHTYEIKNI